MTESSPYGLIQSGAVVIVDQQIEWVGPDGCLPLEYSSFEETDLEQRLVTPALIDCHTHLVYGGNRAKEFEQRLLGVSYEEISRQGGGIMSTVHATRNASEDELFQSALPRLDCLLNEGVGTVEIKSGYGLDLETELKMLRIILKLEAARNVRIKKTFLGAHSIPPEFKSDPDQYIEFVCNEVLPRVAKAQLADAVDGFCENIAFSAQQIKRLFQKATDLGFDVKLHAEQLSNMGGAKMAAEFGALSADHLEYLDDEGIHALAQSNTVAVLLPGAFYSLRETRLPPLDALKKAGVPLAIATDCNPGSSPLNSMLICMNMACTLFLMTPEEALAGATRNAAKALGLEKQTGTIETGKQAELAVWNVDHPAELVCQIGFNPLEKRI